MGGRSHEALHARRAGRRCPRARRAPEALREATRRQDMDGGRASLRRARARSARRGLQRPPVRRPGLHRRPPRRARLAILGLARLHRQGTRPHACSASRCGSAWTRRAAPSSTRTTARKRCGPCCPSCSTARAWRTARPGDRQPDDAWIERMCHTIYASQPGAGRRGGGRGPGRRRRARGRRRGDLAGREPARAPRPRPSRRRTRPRSRRGASMARRSACMPPTPPTPGGTSPGSATAATRTPA